MKIFVQVRFGGGGELHKGLGAGALEIDLSGDCARKARGAMQDANAGVRASEGDGVTWLEVW